ncbi:MAG TPA: TolC family protein, partial [Phycisphaeraceae bacterium]
MTRTVGARVGLVCRKMTVATLVLCGLVSCQTPAEYRQEANEVADRIITAGQKEALGRTEPFTVRSAADTLRRRLIVDQDLPIAGPASLGAEALPRIEHWPEDDFPARYQPGDAPVDDGTLRVLELSLNDSLEVAARNSREYQTQKESVFLSALDLDLALDDFRNTYGGLLESILIHDRTGGGSPLTGIENVGSFSIARRLESGARLAGRIGVDLAYLLTDGAESSIGLIADASVNIPLLRGAGRHIVYEPVTQAQRNVIYAIWDFEDFKQDFAVRVADQYFDVLAVQDRVENQAEKYRNTIRTARRTRRLADAGRARAYDVGQSRQQELSDRDAWIRSLQDAQAALDQFKLTLGLPTDADIVLDEEELVRVAEAASARIGAAEEESQAQEEVVRFDVEPELTPPSREGAGPLELEVEEAIRIALENRLDLRIEQGEVF